MNESKIAQEIELIQVALRGNCAEERYNQYYAAQQALQWALDSAGFMSPYLAIANGKVFDARGTREGLEGCSVPHRQPPSLDICSRVG